MKDEQSLITSAKNGNNEAFGELYDRYLPKIYRFVFLKVGRKQDAEDLTHQVFMQAWEHIGNFEFQGFPFGSWLYRIASNAVIDYYRTFKRTFDIEAIPKEVLAHDPELESSLDSAFSIELVRSAITKLDHDQQNVVIMRFVNDLSTKEIADILGKSEGAVRVIQHRALKQLKQHININGTEPRNTTQEA
ncbi:MAG: sigma-70 family RNA polymerase sigma factor [Candidatus Jorgensenbacteria bacterium]|nr:sigma-70 family RNA polymerase sigma factor [Candidatus Jorgensenbacteria bacterium]